MKPIDELTTVTGDVEAEPARRDGLPLLTPGQQFGAYLIHRRLGRGGMGEVYEAEHSESGRRVALKLLSERDPTPKALERFRREGRLAASFSHSNSVYIYGTEEIEGRWVIAMELVAGGTLRDRLKATGPLKSAEAADIVLQVIAGLEAAQLAGVLHRDIKPANCFVEPDGTVKIGDFGLSLSMLPRDSLHPMTSTSGAVIGTPAFAAPEQLRGDSVDLRADIYSLGATLYCLLTGRPPFDETNPMRLLSAIATEQPVAPHKLLKEIPAGLSAIVLRCLSKEPSARFPDYEALRQALQPFGSAHQAPVPLWKRLGALLVDATALTVVIGALGLDVVSWLLHPVELLALVVIAAAWLGVPGALWGSSLGEWCSGLRLVSRGRAEAGAARALGRGALDGLLTVPLIALLPALGRPEFGSAALALLFFTRRPGGTWQGLPEMLSGTYLVGVPARRGRAPIGAAQRASAVEAGERIGPYQAVRTLRDGDEPLVLGHDPLLDRQVWIRRKPAHAPHVAPWRRDLSRPARIRWLNGGRGEAGWDAWECPAGGAFLDGVRERQPWPRVREWMLGLVEEILCLRRSALDSREAHDLEELTLDGLWMTTQGRVLVLDFQVEAPTGEPSYSVRDLAAVQAFLHRAIWTALAGTVPVDGDPIVPAVPLPRNVRCLLTELHQTSFESLENLAGMLRALGHQAESVTAGTRLTKAALLTAGLLMFLTHLGAQQQYWKPDPRAVTVERSLRRLVEIDRRGPPNEGEIRALEHVVAAAHWHYQPIEPSLRRRAEDLLSDLPRVDELQRQALSRPLPVPEQAHVGVHERLRAGLYLVASWSRVLVGMLIVFALLGLISKMRMFRKDWQRNSPPRLKNVDWGVFQAGGELVSLRGTAPGTLRSLVRGVFFLAPALIGLLYYTRFEEHLVLAAWILAALYAASAAWIVRSPQRGPVEWLTDTVLVPGEIEVDVPRKLQPWKTESVTWEQLHKWVRNRRHSETHAAIEWPEIEELTREREPQGRSVFLYVVGIIAAAGPLIEVFNPRTPPPPPPRSPLEAVLRDREAAEGGDNDARLRLAEVFENGRVVPADLPRAAELYSLAADQRYLKAQYRLAAMYDEGRGVPRDPERAATLFRQAAERGHADAQWRLGRAYATGTGVTRDFAEALSWYMKAAEQDHADAQFEIARHHEAGVGVEKSMSQALDWYRRAAEGGSAVAALRLGLAFEHGDGVETDERVAIYWYEQAAVRGRPEAWIRVAALLRSQVHRGFPDGYARLGKLYELGLGVPVDLSEAARLYSVAAGQGSAGGCLGLGQLYLLGRGVKQDLVAAYMWLTLAVGKEGPSQTPAMSLLLRLEPRLSPAEKSRAAAGVREWLARNAGASPVS